MAILIQTLFKYPHLKIDSNKLEDKGCRAISEGNWPRLIILELSTFHRTSQHFNERMSVTRENQNQIPDSAQSMYSCQNKENNPIGIEGYHYLSFLRKPREILQFDPQAEDDEDDM